MSVATQDSEQYKPLYARVLDEVVDLGATDVELVVRWSQTDVAAIEIAPAPETVGDDLLTWVMDEANTRGLRVFLMPILDVEQQTAEQGRSALAPSNWDRWWWSYDRFITHYARLAGSHRAALLSVGSELVSTESQTERWRELIADVRKIYRGKLTYSARWDHYEPVQFWDAVDVVGISGYHALATGPALPSDQELAQGFAPFARDLRKWALAQGKRYMLTEVGYPAQAHAAQRPWDGRELGPPDLMAQLRCYRALFSAWHDDVRLEGVFASKWVAEGSERSGAESPRGKPAAEVLRHWYRSSKVATRGSVL